MSQKPGSLIVVSFVERPEGEVFSRSQWPLHMTVMPWFGANQAATEEALRQVAGSQAPFEAHVGEQRGFGPSRHIPVNVIDPPDEAVRLHMAVSGALGRVGITVTSYWNGEDYTPHISHYGSRKLAHGDVARVASLSLVRLLGDTKRVRVAAEYPLTGRRQDV